MSKIFNIKDQKSMKRFDELQLQRSNNFDAVSNDVIEIISKIRDHGDDALIEYTNSCLLYTSPSPRDRTRSRMPSSA